MKTAPSMDRPPISPSVTTAAGERDPRESLRVFCFACLNAWTLAHLPISVSDLARVIDHAECPNCRGKDIRIHTAQVPR